MCLVLKVIKFEFGRASLGGNFLRGTPIFVRFSLFLISTHFKNLIHLVLTVKNFKILEDPIEEDPPTWHPQFLSPTCPP